MNTLYFTQGQADGEPLRGPLQSTVPVLNYLKEDRTRSVINKRGNGWEKGEIEEEEQGRERLKQSDSFVMKDDYYDSMNLLEMHMEQFRDDDDEDKILDSVAGGAEALHKIHISPSETIIRNLTNKNM